ncbi:MAG: GIY-YIG nuclease family protein [Bacteroidetes bacterium]|nr:GIY-YIG nuclease family protein [Bacteroidota bacterium]
MKYCCYIIYSKKLDRFYVGYTDDIVVRLSQHNNGISTYTSKASDWELMYKEDFTDRESASLREKFIKSKKSRKYIEWLIISQ